MPKIKLTYNDCIRYKNKIFICPYCGKKFIASSPQKVYCRMVHRDNAKTLINYKPDKLYKLSKEEVLLRDRLLTLKEEGVI